MNNQGLPQRMNALKCKVRSGDEYLSPGSARDCLKYTSISALAMKMCWKEGSVLEGDASQERQIEQSKFL